MSIDPVQHARRWKTLAVLSLSLVIIGLDNTILNVALPTLQSEFDASDTQLQWMLDSYLLAFAGLLLLFGTLSDRLGRKLGLQAGIAIFGLASLAAPFVDSSEQLIAVRAVMGVGAALIMPATLSIIANVFTGAERRKAISIWAAQAAVGIGLGPLAGGLLLEWFDWWSVFMVNVPFAAVALLLGIRYVPESRDARPGRFDLLGATLSTAGFSVLVYAIIEAPDDGWLSASVLASLAVAAGLIGAFLWWEQRVGDPMLELGFFRSARFSVGTVAVSLAFFALLGGGFALTQYLQFAHGYSAIEAGAIMSPMALGLMIGAGSSSKAAGRLGTSRVVAAGLAALAIVLALTALWERDTSPIVLVVWFLALTLPIGWVMAPATDAVIGAVPASRSGVASATNTVARMVAGALGVAIIGSIVSSLYANDVSGSLGTLPPRQQQQAEDSIGAASAIAAHLPAEASSGLLATTGDAFSQAMGNGLLLAAALAALGAVLVARFLPDEPEPEPNEEAEAPAPTHRVVVVGGGFGGLRAVRALRRAPVEVTLVDRQNYTLFQPLVYQVAAGALTAAEIAVPLRSILRRQCNARVELAEVTAFDLARREIVLAHRPNDDGETRLGYDTLIVAGGSRYSYFGHDDWRQHAPELKSLAGALDIRGRILAAFEAAEVEPDPERRRAFLTFVVVGGGPTGVEMAGQIAELARDVLSRDFRSIDTATTRVLLVEAAPRVLAHFPPALSRKAARALERLGVSPLTGHTVIGVDGESVEIRGPGGDVERIAARTAIWAAGVTASPLAAGLAGAAGLDLDLDHAGRITVGADLTLPGHPEVVALGDMVRVRRADGSIMLLPGLAPVAMQQGRYAAGMIRARLRTRLVRPFRYVDKGNLATIGRSKAVADVHGLHLTGFPAWAFWLGVHLVYLIGFQNRLLVMLRWTVSFVTHGRGARLIVRPSEPDEPTALPAARTALARPATSES